MKVFEYQMNEFKKIRSMEDFYRILGALDLIAEEEINTNQIHMNYNDCHEILEILKKNLRKKNKGFKELYPDNLASMDWLNYAPFARLDLAPGKVYIYTKEEAGKEIREYGKLMEQKENNNNV